MQCLAHMLALTYVQRNRKHLRELDASPRCGTDTARGEGAVSGVRRRVCTLWAPGWKRDTCERHRAVAADSAWGLVCHKMCNVCVPASEMDLREELEGARDKRMHPLHPSSLPLPPLKGSDRSHS